MATTDLIGASANADHLGPESAADAEARIARIEQRMADAEALRQAADVPTRETRKVAYRTYEAALTAGRRIGARRADDNALMALFCDGPLQRLVGAVSPELVWDGAQKRGLTTQQLATLANSDVMAVSDLQWMDGSDTAPLPAPAVEALARLELAFAPLSVRKAVVRVLAEMADSLEANEPHDVMTNAARIGRICLFIPGQPELLDLVFPVTPAVTPQITRGEYAAQLRAVTR